MVLTRHSHNGIKYHVYGILYGSMGLPYHELTRTPAYRSFYLSDSRDQIRQLADAFERVGQGVLVDFCEPAFELLGG